VGFIGADGKYYSGTPQMASMVPERTTIWKQSDHDRQRQEYKKDLIKPYLPNGDPNPDFVEQYPEESKHTYKFIPTEEDIERNQ
jgi:hypothetical protein